MQLSQAPSRRWLLSQPRTLRRGVWPGNSSLAVAFARATGEGSPEGAFWGGDVHNSTAIGFFLLGRRPATARKNLQGIQLLSYESLAT